MSTISNRGPTEGLRPEPKTRVDAAHASAASVERSGPAAPPPLELLQAIAGYGTQVAAQQLRGQALELAGILRDKQRLLEQRESELNARTALLENDLRAARLRHFRDAPPRISNDRGDETLAATTAPGRPPQDGLAEPTSPRPSADHQADSDRSPPPSPGQAALGQPSGVRRDVRSPAREVPPKSPAETPRAEPPQLTSDELHAQFEHLEQQRQLLRHREEKLARRQQHVEQLHEEITQLHREALELRLASEQVWGDLMDEFPSEELSQTMHQVRCKLADHYRMANDALARRKDELHELRNDLNLQEQRLRQQRREIQMWADRRYDEIEARTAKIIARERELDQLESEFQRQSIQWQQQREAYRQEIEQLSWQLHDTR
jgi:hypothetical protein